MFLPWFSTVIIILSALPCSYGQNNPTYICGGDDDKDGRPVCECKTTVCYFKLNIEHYQVSLQTSLPHVVKIKSIRDNPYFRFRENS